MLRSRPRWLSTSTGTSYAAALDKLSLLQSNRQITRQFDPATPSSSSSSSSSQAKNAAAIPEMLSWLSRAGYTPSSLCAIRHIHVAGTKGKGSVCAYASSMLGRATGRPVGMYTSPHLVSPRERIAIDGAPVSQDVFAAGVHELWERFSASAAATTGVSAAEAEGPATKPFFFRFMTILAWHVFLTQGVRDVVLECGIGGEHDATNVVPASAVSAAVVTQLGLDHVGMLGGTVGEIAWHKTGVFKPGVPAVTRRLADEGVMGVVRARAGEKRVSRLVEVDDAAVDAWGGVRGHFRGDFQRYNQALAVVAVREHLAEEGAAWGDEGEDLSGILRGMPDAMVEGLRSARLRGRGETLRDGRATWLLDGAHTSDSLRGVAASLAGELGPRESIVLVFNQQERNASDLLRHLVGELVDITGRRDVFSHAIFTTNDLDRPRGDAVRDTTVQRDAAATMAQLAPGAEVSTCDSLPEVVERVRSITAAAGETRVLATGSMYLVGGILRTLEPDSLL